MANRMAFWLGLVVAVMAFAIADGLSENQIGDSIRAVPIGVGAVGLLYLPLTVVTRRWQSFRGVTSYLLGVGVGAAAGAFLSIIIWALIGGWGPPFFLPSIVAGAMLASSIIVKRRGRRPIKALSV